MRDNATPAPPTFEARLRRALIAVSAIVTVGFAADAIWSYHISVGAEKSANKFWWPLYNEAANECERDPHSFYCERKKEYSKDLNARWELAADRMARAEASALWALVVPLIGIGIFFLYRWVWIGRIRVSYAELERPSTGVARDSGPSLAADSIPNATAPDAGGTVRGVCPACRIEVEYEQKGANGYCPLCGRTQKAAEQAIQARKESARDAKLKWLWISLTICGVAIAVVISYERALSTLISTLVQVTGLAVVIWLTLKIKTWIGKRADKRTRFDRDAVTK